MSTSVRALLIVAAVFTNYFMLRSIRKSKLLISDALFWFFFSLLLIIMAILPGIIMGLAEKLGIISAANLVYLIVIGLLVMRIFQMDMKISQLQTKLTHLVQEIGIQEHEEKNDSH